jgi:glucose-6-phosphate dehydrogenase assembly protein OpcA
MSAPVVPLRDVDRELNRQAKVLQGPGDNPVLRARMSNLVIFCNSAEQASRLDQDLPNICAVHPARVLLLIGERDAGDRPLQAEVCVRPLRIEARRFAFVEQVTLQAGGTGVEHLPFAVRSLLIGDLPTNLWWAAAVPPPLAGPLLYELAENAQQILYDSIGWPDPTRGVAATGSWLEQVERADHGDRWRVASDLNWRRLKYWRRLVTQSLDPASAPGAAESATELLVEHGPHAVVQAWMLASWLSRRLGWKVQGGKVEPGRQIDWRFTSPRGTTWVRVRRLGEGPPEVRRLRIACKLEDRPGAMDLVAEGPQRLAIRLEGVEAAPRTLSVPPAAAAELVGRQLNDRERDPVFRESMAVAQVMAQSLLQ